MIKGPARSAIVYDVGALIAAEANKRTLWVDHVQALAEARQIVVPAPVLAQVWRGSARQASLARLLFGCEVASMTEAVGKEAGALCGLAGTTDVVDATVVVTAIQRTASIVTSDPEDLRKLIDAARPAIKPALIVV